MVNFMILLGRGSCAKVLGGGGEYMKYMRGIVKIMYNNFDDCINWLYNAAERHVDVKI